jgi:hypothetical protein
VPPVPPRCSGGLVVEHLHAQQRRAAQWAQASEFNRAQLLPNTPGRAARTLLRGIADDDPIICTTLLAPAAGDQLAAAVGATDCAGAVLSSVSRIIRRILALLAVHRGPTASSRSDAQKDRLWCRTWCELRFNRVAVDVRCGRR